jgi:hypothetical protein
MPLTVEQLTIEWKLVLNNNRKRWLALALAYYFCISKSHIASQSYFRHYKKENLRRTISHTTSQHVVEKL